MTARYGTVSGGYSPWMYCTSIAAVLCGREILGYPKQLADIDFVATDIAATGVVRKNGVDLVKLGFVFDDKENPDIDKIVNLQKINVNRILYKTIPKATDYTADLKQVIFRDSARKVGHSKPGRGSVVFGELESDPIGVIGIKRILGATYTISNYGGGLEKEKRTVLAEL